MLLRMHARLLATTLVGGGLFLTAALVLLLALAGAGSKAGLVPLHVWLPLAHPAAPSHVSALMSGVMTKVAIYGFIRVVFDLLGEPGIAAQCLPVVMRSLFGCGDLKLAMNAIEYLATSTDSTWSNRLRRWTCRMRHPCRSNSSSTLRGERTCWGNNLKP